MRRNPERTAWVVLYSTFFVWCALAVAIPLGGRWWLLHASTSQTITMQSSGTVIVTRPDRDTPEVNLVDIPVGSTLVTQTDSQATLTFTSTDGREALAILTVYGNTKLVVTRADRPRYGTGVNPSRIDLQVLVGRLRAAISPNVSRAVQIWMYSKPEAITVLGVPGSYVSLETTLDESVVTVREGEALVIAQSRGVTVSKDERAEVNPNATPNGPLPAERNWIVNGDFQQPLGAGWTTAIRQPNIPAEDWGKVEIVTTDERSAVQFLRAGQAWGQAGIVQEINRDLTDYKSLRLHLAVFVSLQDLWNCGAVGTECPAMVDITFVDKGGGERHWLKGFYYRFNENPAFGLTSCPSCNAVSSGHELILVGEWRTFDSLNLLEEFSRAGVTVVTIKSIAIYGGGHIFDSQVTEVELLAQE